VRLKEFGLISSAIEAAEVFGAIETAIPIEVIEQTISHTAARQERKRKLPSSLVVCLVIAMSLWSGDSMGTVLKNLVNGLSRQWTKLGQYWKVPNSSSISAARERVGCRVISQLSRASSATISHRGNAWSIFRGVASDGSRWNSAGCAR
jgi:hypothetical protein